MKQTALIPKPHFARTQRLEIGSGFGHHISVETELDPSQGFSIDGDVEEDVVGDLGFGGPAGENVGEEVHAESSCGGAWGSDGTVGIGRLLDQKG